MADSPPERRFCADRRRRLEAFASESREWIEKTDSEARGELYFSAPGDWDYEYSMDMLLVVEQAKATLAAVEKELQEIRERNDVRGS